MTPPTQSQNHGRVIRRMPTSQKCVSYYVVYVSGITHLLSSSNPQKLTKKDITETNKETARLLAAKNVSIKQSASTWQPKPKPMAGIFNSLKRGPSMSDPIEAFSSPANPRIGPSSSGTTLVPSSSFGADYVETPVHPSTAPARPTSTAIVPLALASTSANRPNLLSMPRKQALGLIGKGKGKGSASASLPATSGTGPEADSDEDDEDILTPQALNSMVTTEARHRRAAEAKKQAYLKAQSQSQVITAQPDARVQASDDDDDDLEIIPTAPAPAATASSSSKSKSKAGSPFLDNAVSRVQRPTPSSRHSLPDIRRRPLPSQGGHNAFKALRGNKSKPVDLKERNNTILQEQIKLQREKMISGAREDYVERGGTLKDAQALTGPTLDEILKEQSARRVKEEEEGAGAGASDEDEEDGEYRPPGENTADADGDEAMQSGSDAEPLHGEGDETIDPASSFQSTSTSASESLFPKPPPSTSRSSSDTELADSQLTFAPRKNGRSRASRRVILDEDDEDIDAVENALAKIGSPHPHADPDSDAENTRPPTPIHDDSDLENRPPAVVQQVQVMTMDSDSDHDVPVGDGDNIEAGQRSPLKRLTSFSSSSFSMSDSGVGLASGSGSNSNNAARSGPFRGASSPRPLSELDGPEAEAEDTDEADADFGFGGMSQLFGGDTQTQTQGRTSMVSYTEN